MKKIIEKFFNELLNDKKFISELSCCCADDKFALNFSLAIYLRNEYLWNNDLLVCALAEHYSIQHIDDISVKVINRLYDSVQNNNID